ncbi:YajG family lipoprotein [Psychromonas sp. KJ10-10]|uniref:YajG family lipoprotein n=1 Tax=Psychromonas sp. KJ10-10 TaxID=3391823 RepID=UPI0039B4870B
MNIHLLKLVAILLSTLLLATCSSTPTSLELTPKLQGNITGEPVQSQQDWLIKSKDLRTARYLIAISSGDEVAQLINESTSTRQTVERLLQHNWQKQGHLFTNKENHSHQIEIQLIKLLAEVEQRTLSHETEINAIIKVQLQSNQRTYSKTFRSHYEEKSPLSAKVNSLATQLNEQLSQLLEQILQDEELNNKLLNL